MGRERAAGIGLGAIAALGGVVALAVDASALGLAAGAAGLLAGALVVLVAGRADRAEAAQRDAEAAHESSQQEAAAAEARAGELQGALDALRSAPAPEPEIGKLLADPETGLPGETFFAISLDSRVAGARRNLRPVSVVLLEVADRKGHPAEVTIVAEHLHSTLRQADTACRLEGECRFGLVLEDTPENGAVWTVERFRRALAADENAVTILWAGIACYPAHAFDAGELRQRATDALGAARQWRQDRIEVATSSEA
jgi:diguanylate cyclase (GGDEF)-like protein